MNVPKAILFDMDDTIVYWPVSPEIVWERLCLRYAPGVDGLTPQKLLEAINNTRAWYWQDPERHRTGRLDLNKARREVVRLSLAGLDIVNPALVENITADFIADREQTSALEPGALETLEDLRRRGIKLALVTNGGSDMQRAKIKKFSLAPFFENILVEGEFGCGKPDERVFNHTLAKLKVKPADAWMAGDDLGRDILPCRALGIYSLWVDMEGKGLPETPKARPDAIIRNISEIPGMLSF